MYSLYDRDERFGRGEHIAAVIGRALVYLPRAEDMKVPIGFRNLQNLRGSAVCVGNWADRFVLSHPAP